MSTVAPSGSVYQAGTLSGNPVALAAGLKTLELIGEECFFERLEEKTRRLCQGLQAAAQDTGVPFCCDWQGGMFGFFFCKTLPVNLPQVKQANSNLFRAFHQATLQRGFYFAPSAFEAGFMSSAHSLSDIDATVAAAREVFAELKEM